VGGDSPREPSPGVREREQQFHSDLQALARDHHLLFGIRHPRPELSRPVSKRPTWQLCRSEKSKKSLAYLRKEDQDPLEFGERKGEGSPKSSVSTEIATLILGGKTTRDLIKSHPGFVLMNGTKINNFQSSIATMNGLTSGEKAASVSYTGVDMDTKAIVDWISKNFLAPRNFKQKQLFCWGPPDHNKTSLMLLVGGIFSLYWVATLEDFFNDFNEDIHDAMVFDEFVTRDLPTLNKILEGGVARLRTKGGQVVKKKNIPVIILSNAPPERWYRGNLLLPAFLSRIEIIELKSPIDIDKIKFI